MSNKVVSSASIKTIVKAGRSLGIKFATETQDWKRSYLAQSIKDNFADSVAKLDIPAGATTVIMVETEHPSKKDSYSHYTAVYLNDKGEFITKKHVYPQ